MSKATERMKGRCKRNRCSVKVKLFSLIIAAFVLVHTKYLLSLDREEVIKDYELPESLMLFSKKLNSTKALAQIHISSSKTCKPKRAVVFVKTHKTGSTTMTNIFLRYAKKHRLSVGLPPHKRWELAGYPAIFNEKLIDPQLKTYEMLCHHFRMTSKEKIMQVMPAATVFVTIIRDPANAFESGFSFFRDYPFSVWMEDYTSPNSLAKFLDAPIKYYNKSTPWYFRAKNYQAFDLGFDHEREDEAYIQKVLNEMEYSYDLVMITERMEESLILLKNLLCMDSLNDISFIKLKVRQNALRRVPDDKMIQQMHQWNGLDSAIYEYFSKKLEMRIEEFGWKKMASQANDLRIRSAEIERKCVSEYDNEDLRPWISRIRLNKGANQFCRELSWGEVKFGDHIRSIQKKYISIRNELQIPEENMKRLLDREQKRVLKI